MVFIVMQAAPVTGSSVRPRYKYSTQHTVLKSLLAWGKVTKLHPKRMQQIQLPYTFVYFNLYCSDWLCLLQPSNKQTLRFSFFMLPCLGRGFVNGPASV